MAISEIGKSIDGKGSKGKMKIKYRIYDLGSIVMWVCLHGEKKRGSY